MVDGILTENSTKFIEEENYLYIFTPIRHCSHIEMHSVQFYQIFSQSMTKHHFKLAVSDGGKKKYFAFRFLKNKMCWCIQHSMNGHKLFQVEYTVNIFQQNWFQNLHLWLRVICTFEPYLNCNSKLKIEFRQWTNPNEKLIIKLKCEWGLAGEGGE